MKHIYLNLILLLMLSYQSEAQQRNGNVKLVKRTNSKTTRTEISPYSLNLKGGLTQFFGELNQQDMRSSFGIGLDRKLNKNISLSLNYSAGKIGGQKMQLFNSYFINEYNTVEILTKWNLTEQFGHSKSKLCDISVYAGLGLMFFNSNAFDINTGNLLRFSNSDLSKRNQIFLRWGNPGGKAGIKKTRERVIPIGTSVDYLVSEKWVVGMDYRFYFIRTDKADATSGQRLVNPEEKNSYSDTPNDKFSVLSVSLTHYFAKARKH